MSEVLTAEGFDVYAIDASPTMIETYRQRFPQTHVECAAVEDSKFFHRTFDGIVALGLMFLLPADIQIEVLGQKETSITTWPYYRPRNDVHVDQPLHIVQTHSQND